MKHTKVQNDDLQAINQTKSKKVPQSYAIYEASLRKSIVRMYVILFS